MARKVPKKIFYVTGPERSGKGAAVRSVLKKLEKEFPEARRVRDVRVVLKIGETRIGIESDCHFHRPAGSLKGFSHKRGSEHCRIIICAATSRRQISRALAELNDNEYEEKQVSLNGHKATVASIVKAVKEML
jgi:hypothetical protein